MTAAMAVHFLVGDDESILRAAVSALVHTLVGDGDRSLMVDEHDQEDASIAAVVDAAQTPPFLTDTRVVVARDVGRFNVDELRPLVEYLAEPLDSTELVIEWGSERRPRPSPTRSTKAAVAVTSTAPPSRPRDRQAWVLEAAGERGVRLDSRAAGTLAEHLGENVSSLDGILRTLAATYGEGTLLRDEQITPFLGDAGGVPPWDLTDAIDAGRTELALTLLTRMLGAGERHPLQVTAILQSHYGKLAALDGLDVRTEAEAAAAMGIKPGYPARKAMELSRTLGRTAVQRAIDLLASADLDLRGRRMLDEEVVMEVLVARLSRLFALADQPAASAAAALTVCCRRLLRRAAWLGWITPLAAALSRRFTARRTSSPLASEPMLLVAFLTRVLSSLRTALLRSARLALVRLRFFWLLMLATDRPSGCRRTAAQGYRDHPGRPTLRRVRVAALVGSIDTPWTALASATSRSSPTSTTASRRCPIASSRSPAPSTRVTCASSTSTRWTSSASGGSRSRRRTCGSSGAATCST